MLNWWWARRDIELNKNEYNWKKTKKIAEKTWCHTSLIKIYKHTHTLTLTHAHSHASKSKRNKLNGMVIKCVLSQNSSSFCIHATHINYMEISIINAWIKLTIAKLKLNNFLCSLFYILNVHVFLSDFIWSFVTTGGTPKKKNQSFKSTTTTTMTTKKQQLLLPKYCFVFGWFHKLWFVCNQMRPLFVHKFLDSRL